MKKYFLSSMLVMGLMVPAFGADGIITGGAGTCTVDVLGVSDNNATANTIATWTLNEYECGAGQYLLNSDGTLECTECPVGSYCPGGKFTVESENNGVNTCPTDYTSDAGAVGEEQCFTECNLQCTQQACPEHSENCTHIASSNTGRQYYGKTCDAVASMCEIIFTCEPGYTVRNLKMSDFIHSVSTGYSICEYQTTQDGGYTHNCNTVKPGEYIYEFNAYGLNIFESLGISTLYLTLISNEYGPDTPGVFTKKCRNCIGEDNEQIKLLYANNFVEGDNGQHYWIKPTAISYFGPDMVLMESMVQLYGDDIPEEAVNQISSELLRELFKKVLQDPDYVPTLTEQEALSIRKKLNDNIPWIYLGTADDVHKINAYRGLQIEYKLYSVYSETEDYVAVSYCQENVININWQTSEETSVMSMCPYGGSILLPADPVKPGYTFTGWKLLESTTTE